MVVVEREIVTSCDDTEVLELGASKSITPDAAAEMERDATLCDILSKGD
jgi:hypothetical protein